MASAHIKPDEPKKLDGFEHINSYWDSTHHKYVSKILPGEFYVSQSDELIATVLGSCISVCITDKVAGVGGMNHFMLPILKNTQDYSTDKMINDCNRYGNYAMENLINEILRFGGSRSRIELKVIGGGRVMKQMTDVGARNIAFIYDYIADERLKIVKEDVGDIYPRKVLFHPLIGKVWVRKLKKMNNNTISAREEEYLENISSKKVEGSVELF